MHTDRILSRRAVLAVSAVTAAGAGAAALAACSSSTSSSSSPPPTARSTAAGADTTGTGSSVPAGAASSSGSGSAHALATLADIKVGEAVSARLSDGTAVLVARPTETSAACFNAKCTHLGCTVAPAGKERHCPCHGSVYDATTGAVVHGPAPKALAPVPVKVVGGAVVPSG